MYFSGIHLSVHQSRHSSFAFDHGGNDSRNALPIEGDRDRVIGWEILLLGDLKLRNSVFCTHPTRALKDRDEPFIFDDLDRRTCTRKNFPGRNFQGSKFA